MIKVIFFCNWGNNSKEILNSYKLFTPNNSGKYNNIIGVNNINNSNVVIFLEGIPKNFNCNLLKNKLTICYPREPFFERKKNWEKFKLKYGFTYDNHYHVITNPQFIDKTYDFLNKLKYDKIIKNKKLSAISSGLSKTSGHLNRKNFIIKLSNIFSKECEIYGGKWNNELNKDSYKGELGGYHNKNKSIESSKFEGLINYNFSICIENMQRKNYFSEKFTDAILCYTIPIYYGCPNIEDYFPKDCYYIIDINDVNVFDKIKEIINKPITEKQIQAINEARELILNKYNIWATTDKILKNHYSNDTPKLDL